jgi:hypothetical protein
VNTEAKLRGEVKKALPWRTRAIFASRAGKAIDFVMRQNPHLACTRIFFSSSFLFILTKIGIKSKLTQ